MTRKYKKWLSFLKIKEKIKDLKIISKRWKGRKYHLSWSTCLTRNLRRKRRNFRSNTRNICQKIRNNRAIQIRIN